MVDFVLNQEQKEYQKLARDFAQRELANRAHQFDQSGDFPADLLRKAWESGLLNVQLPEKFGGLALGCWDAAVIAEELAYGCTGIASGAEGNALAILPLLNAGSDALQAACFSPFADRCLFAALPYDLFEPQRGSRLTVKRDGSNYELSGELPFVLGAEHGSWLLVEAAPDSASDSGASLFAVPRTASGITIGDKVALLGRKAADLRSVKFDKVRLSDKETVGTAGGASQILDAVRPSAYVLLAAAGVGLARSAMEHSIRYSKERHTFGQPIAQHQAVAFMIADMAKDIESARLLTWQAAVMIDSGHGNLKAAAIARNFSQSMAMRVTTDAVQVFGGYGYSREYPVEKLMRDAKMYQLFGGTGPQLGKLVGQELIGV